MNRRVVSAVCVCIGLSGPVQAAEGPAPFQSELLRLSEILGAVTYLDGLCDTGEAEAWRAAMRDLIEAQRMSPEDRRRYVDFFNRGHRTFASVHRSCSERTRYVLGRYFAEGAAIAARIEDRFGRGIPGPEPDSADPAAEGAGLPDR